MTMNDKIIEIIEKHSQYKYGDGDSEVFKMLTRDNFHLVAKK